MFASVLIIVFSFALLVYWFRYSCMLLLRSQSDLAASVRATSDSRFHIAEVREALREGAALNALHASLERDYRILTYLLRHAAGLELGSFEDHLLVLDYKVMRAWYRLTRIAAPLQARGALSEMASVLDIL